MEGHAGRQYLKWKGMEMDIIIIAAGILLIAYAVWQTVQRFRGKAKNTCCGGAEVVSVKKVEDTDVTHYPYRYRLSVEGMKCSNCAKNVENALNGMAGVWAKVNLGKKEADVRTKQPVDEAAFEAAMSSTPYKLTGYSAV